MGRRRLSLAKDKKLPPKETRKYVLPMVRGLGIFLFLVAASTTYLLSVRGQPGSPLVDVTTTDSPVRVTSSIETEAEEPPQEIPEQVSEEDAPKTPTPGFMDDFDNGLDPVWTVIFGDPFIINGQLTSNVGAGISAGDSSWRNYQIDFDVDTTHLNCAFVDTSNSVGVRTTDFDHAYWFVFDGCEAAWSFFAGGLNQGVVSLFPDTRVNTSKATKHITIKVEETKMSGYENGSFLSSIVDSRFQTGGLFLQIETQTFYDNFSVTLLP